MTLLALGLAIWMIAHFFMRFAPECRAAMGEKGKGPVAIVLVMSLLLMIIGYRTSDIIPVYTPIPGIGHLNNLLMFGAIFLLGVGSSKGVLASELRHPMLLGVTVWGVAHLLVNGDLASILLFGGMIVWAVAEMIVINRATGPWIAPQAGPKSKDIKLIGITLILFVIFTGVHTLLGYNPFLGTYG
ncbi:MAG: NnrU family protein [Pseudoruegeria sp.]